MATFSSCSRCVPLEGILEASGVAGPEFSPWSSLIDGRGPEGRRVLWCRLPLLPHRARPGPAAPGHRGAAPGGPGAVRPAAGGIGRALRAPVGTATAHLRVWLDARACRCSSAAGRESTLRHAIAARCAPTKGSKGQIGKSCPRVHDNQWVAGYLRGEHLMRAVRETTGEAELGTTVGHLGA